MAAPRRESSADSAARFLASRSMLAGQACARCGRQRFKYERGWRWIYPDIAPPYSLSPLAVICPVCPEAG